MRVMNLKDMVLPFSPQSLTICQRNLKPQANRATRRRGELVSEGVFGSKSLRFGSLRRQRTSLDRLGEVEGEGVSEEGLKASGVVSRSLEPRNLLKC